MKAETITFLPFFLSNNTLAMCKIKFIKDDGCFPLQKLISCAIDHNRLHEVYGLGKIVYVCDDINDVKRFVSDVHPESGIHLLDYDGLKELPRDVDTVYIESSEKFSVTNSLQKSLLKLKVSTIITNEPRRTYNV